jgi:hypothetical protein
MLTKIIVFCDDTMLPGANLRMFHRNLLLPSSGWEMVAAHVSEISAN